MKTRMMLMLGIAAAFAAVTALTSQPAEAAWLNPPIPTAVPEPAPVVAVGVAAAALIGLLVKARRQTGRVQK